MKKNKQQDWIDRANKSHNNFYDYGLLEYINSQSKVKIICPIHGEFFQKANDHVRGVGCKECSKSKISQSKMKSVDEFVVELNKKYDGDITLKDLNYVGNNVKTVFICQKHGEFEQYPKSLLNGHSCPECSGRVFDNNSFIEHSKLIHGSRYDYSESIYISARSKIKIICPIHGEFSQKPNGHLSGRGCPKCTRSKGEIIIADWLEKNSIRYESEKWFDGCRGTRRPLPFDFYLSDYNICLEYDGEQHYRAVRFNGMSEDRANDSYRKIVEHDEVKNRYCGENGIRLIRFKYDLDYSEIYDILEEITSGGNI